MKQLDDAGLAALVDDIYDAATTPGQWQPVLTRIMRGMDGLGGALLVTDDTAAVQMVTTSGVFADPAVIADYNAHYTRLDPAPAQFARRPPGVPASTHELIPPDGRTGSAFYHEFFRPLGLVECLGATLFHDHGRFGLIGIQRGAAVVTKRELAIFGEITAHLRRALRIHRQFAALSARSALTADTLDALDLGVLVVDATARVLYVNATAGRIAARNDGLTIRPGALLAAAHPLDAARLARAIGEAATRRSDGGALPLRRRSGEPSYAVMVAPLPSTLAARDGFAAPHRQAALVLVRDPSRPPGVSAELLRDALALTASEARLVAALLAGDSLAGYAERAGITRHTARFHLKSIFAKTGTASQGQLIAAVYRTVAIVAPSSAARDHGAFAAQ